MFKAFSQSKVTYKIFFQTKFKNILFYEEQFIYPMIPHIIGVSNYEIASETIDPRENDDWMIEIYLSKKPSLNSLTAKLVKFSKEHNLELVSNVKVEKINDKDWIKDYQSKLAPLEVGQFFISSKIFKDFCPENKTGIFLEASRAFGTGEHATTIGCIEAIIKLKNLNFKKILDVGTGTGILSFVAEKIWLEAKILACDIEEVAVHIAKENAANNNSKVMLYKNSEFNILPSEFPDYKFDLIISNILAEPLIEFAPIFKKISTNSTFLILSGFLDYQERSIFDAYNQFDFQLIDSIYKGSWVILILKLNKN